MLLKNQIFLAKYVISLQVYLMPVIAFPRGKKQNTYMPRLQSVSQDSKTTEHFSIALCDTCTCILSHLTADWPILLLDAEQQPTHCIAI